MRMSGSLVRRNGRLLFNDYVCTALSHAPVLGPFPQGARKEGAEKSFSSI